MPLYYFHMTDAEEIEGECELPDDATAIKFATEIAQQLSQKAVRGDASVRVTNAQSRQLCRIVIKGESLH